MKKEIEQPIVDQKKDECANKVKEILDEYGYDLGIVGFCLVAKK